MDSSQFLSFFLPARLSHFLHLSDTCLIGCCGLLELCLLDDLLWNENLTIEKWVTTVYEDVSWSRRRNSTANRYCLESILSQLHGEKPRLFVLI